MKPIYKKYFTTIALIWTGCFVLFLFTYMLLLIPQRKAKGQIEKQLAEKEQIYNSAFKASQEETKIKLNDEIERLQNQFKDFVINFEDTANLTFDISQIAAEKKVTSFSLRTEDNRKDSVIPNCDYISENHINISFTAGFNQFAALLNALERHRPVIFIDRFTISRSVGEDNSGHQVNMDISVFVKKRQDS